MIWAADANPWRFQPHPEVWAIIVIAVGLSWYAARVIGPKAVAPGEPVTTRRNRIAFGLGLLLLWIASDWPVHDISEEYLYFVHMLQHMAITMFIPPLMLMAVPEWLARLTVSESGSAGVWIRRLSAPVIAGVMYNAVQAITHTTQVVNFSVENGLFHYAVHLLVFLTALAMWVPVLSPLPELRISAPGQMIYLFAMSLLPTVPAAFLTFAENPIYDSYDHNIRVWGISVATDQQAAGAVMKLGGGIFLWIVIGVLFFQWVAKEMSNVRPEPGVAAAPLTYDQVTRAFDETEPATEQVDAS